MISVEKAKQLINGWIKKVKKNWPSEYVSLRESLGRVTVDPIIAPMNVPSFDNSAMDGFAIRSCDTKKASPDKPVSLSIIGEIKAGDFPISLDQPQTAIRIMTGSPLPNGASPIGASPIGADAVVPKEKVIEQQGIISISQPVNIHANVRFAGEDIKKGNLAIKKGTLLTPSRIAFLASLGIGQVKVASLPRISVFTTGHELVDPSQKLEPGKIFNSNSLFLETALKEINVLPLRVAQLEDDPSILENKITEALQDSDILILTGGVSVGEHDYTREVLLSCGVKPLFWKVAQKPGKPLFVGTLKNKIIFGLPGNSYAVVACFYVYIRPLLLSLMGCPQSGISRYKIKSNSSVQINDAKRSLFLKARLLPRQGSHCLSSMAEADLLIYVPKGLKGSKNHFEGVNLP